MIKRTIITTSDGSKTVYLPDWDESYHSRHGAVQEAYHVFLQNGLYLFENRPLDILEIGFGTGLNALITYKEHIYKDLKISYTAVEAYPLSVDEIEQMDYVSALGEPTLQSIYSQMHTSEWNVSHSLSESFVFTKRKQFFEEIDDEATFDLIYFDAFGAGVQPELWTEIIFRKMYNALRENGVLVTYSCKGSVRRAMLACGFHTEKLPGPPGKREMLRAVK